MSKVRVILHVVPRATQHGRNCRSGDDYSVLLEKNLVVQVLQLDIKRVDEVRDATDME